LAKVAFARAAASAAVADAFTENEICSTCSDPRRNPRLLCVVETPADQAALERSDSYQGLYFVLMGRISPLDGMGVDAWREAAGMDWRIHRSKVRYATCANAGPHEFIEVPESHVLFRSDTKAHLGVVSDKYKVVQPAEVLEFFRDIAASGGLALSAAGTIYGGKRFWATAKIGEASPASLRDKIGGYLLISTSADGSMATEVRRTTIRTVCRNTLAMALAVSQVHVVPLRTVRTTSLNIGGIFGARALPKVDTVNFTPPRIWSVSRSTCDSRTK
jgi:hypothetical protein